MDNSIIFFIAIIWTLKFEWYVIRYEPKAKKHPKNASFKEIGLHAYNMLYILESIVNMIEWDLCDHSMSIILFTLIMKKIFIQAPKVMRKVVVGISLIY